MRRLLKVVWKKTMQEAMKFAYANIANLLIA
jgi:hypothetical protein